MSVRVEFSLPARTFLFADVAEADPDLEIDLDPIVPTTGDALPFFWVRGGDFDRFERLAGGDERVADMDCLERTAGGRLYRVDWTGTTPVLLEGITASDAAILDASLANRRWRFTLRFPTPTSVRSFQQFCIDNDVPTNVYRVADGPTDGTETFGLTEKQREALRTAYRLGYYDRPRRTDLDTIGEELGISPQAVSQRLRRAVERLVTNTVTASDSSDY